jgi:putative transposase
MEASDVKRLKELEEENARLKRMYANLAMDNEILRDLFTKKGWALPPKGN